MSDKAETPSYPGDRWWIVRNIQWVILGCAAYYAAAGLLRGDLIGYRCAIHTTTVSIVLFVSDWLWYYLRDNKPNWRLPNG